MPASGCGYRHAEQHFGDRQASKAQRDAAMVDLAKRVVRKKLAKC